MSVTFTSGANSTPPAGTVVDTGSGNLTSTGTQRVVLASDQPAYTVNAIPSGSAASGASMYSLVSAATANATLISSTQAQIYAVYVTNTNAAVRYVKFYNSASAPTAGSGTPVWRMAIPGSTAGGGGAITLPVGISFSTGLGFTIVTGAADSDATAVAANEIILNVAYSN